MIHICLLSFLILASLNCNAQDLDTILEQNTAAHGGSENLLRVENIRILLSIEEPGFEVSGTYVANRDGNMRIDIEAGGEPVFREGLYQGKAWQWTPGDGYTEQDEKSAAALSHGIDFPGRFFSMEQVRERGATISLMGEATDRDRKQWQLRLVLPDGFSRDYYVDQETGRTVRQRDYRAFHPAIDATRETIETRFDGELWINGVLYANRSENRNVDTGDWLGTTQVQSVEHNIDIEATFFQPGEQAPAL